MKKDLSFLLYLIPFLLLFRSASPKETALFFLSALLHELGHLGTIYALGYKTERFFLSPAGAGIGLDTVLIPYRKEIFIYLSGPFLNVLSATGALFLIRNRPSPTLFYFFFCNVFLCLINLLPICGLDGYQTLFSLISMIGNPEMAERILIPLSRATLVILTCFGLALFFSSKGASLLIFCLMLFWEQERKKATNIS